MKPKEIEKAAKLALEQLREEAELRKSIAESASGYAKAMKDLKDLNKDILNVSKQINLLQSKSRAGLTQDEIDIEDKKLDILKKQLATLEDTAETYKKVIKGANAYTKSLSVIDTATKDVKKLYKTISGGYNFIKSWSNLFEVDKSIRTASTSMGLLGKRSDMFRKNLSLAAGQSTIFGADIKELAAIQATYSDELGRASLLSAKALVDVAAISEATGLGAENTGKMVADFERQGISAERTAKFINQVVNDSSRMGINSTKVVKNIQQNLKLLNKYNFSGGVNGLAKMAKTATKLGIDMNFVSGMAEKLFDIEGAVDMSAQLQVLGGEWSKLADPFRLMYMARNDVGALQEEVIKAASASARFSKETGKFEIGAMEMQRLRKIAEATGLEFEELSSGAKAAAQAAGKRNQIRYNFDPETKEFIENVSFINKKGEAVISLESGDKLVKQLTMADYQAIRAAKNEQASLAKRAQEAKTFDETLGNVITQFKQLLLPFLNAFDKAFRPVAERLSRALGDKKLIKGIEDAAKVAADVLVFMGKFIAENPITSLVTAIAGFGLFEAAKWIANGVALGIGFNGVAGIGGRGGFGVMGGGKGRMVNGKLLRNTKSMRSGGLLKGAGTLTKGLGKAAFPLAAIGVGIDAYQNFGDENMSSGKAFQKTLDQNKYMATGAAIGAGLGFAGGPFAPVTVPGGALVGAGIGGIVDFATSFGKNEGLWGDYGVNDGLFNSMTSKGGMKSRRAILQGGNVTPIDNKDDIIAMKPGGAIDKFAGKDGGYKVVKHEFGDLNINGEIVLTGANNQKIDANILRDPQFVRAITQMVQVEARKIKNQTEQG